MSKGMRDPVMRELNEQELDAITGGGAVDALTTTINLIEQTVFVGAAIMLGLTTYLSRH